MLIVKELMPKNDYTEKFKSIIQYDDWQERRFIANRTNYYSFIQSVDYNSCKTLTPSYKLLPSSIITPNTQGSTNLHQANLNDVAISITAGSEDFSFKATRKNIYEEALFKTEDERFELDILIEQNYSTIIILEQINNKLKEFSSNEAKR